MASTVIRGRHHGFTSAGLPLVRQLNVDSCLDTPISFPQARHVGFGATTGLPLLAKGVFPCCKEYSTDLVAKDCYPPDGLPSIFGALVQNALYCQPDGDVNILFTWDGGGWTSSVVLPNGTLELRLTCDPLADPTDPCKWKLTYGGCSVLGAVCAGAVLCTDPLTLLFDYNPDQVPTPSGAPGNCCGCLDSDPKLLNITLFVNCKPRVPGRHVGYTSTGIPLVAIPNRCPDQNGRAFNPCCPDQTTPTELSLAFTSPCCGATVPLTFVPNYYGPCSGGIGAWVFDGFVCGQPLHVDWGCNVPPGGGSPGIWTLNFVGCITATLGADSSAVDCAAGDTFVAAGGPVTVGCSAGCGGGSGDLSWVITEPS